MTLGGKRMGVSRSANCGLLCYWFTSTVDGHQFMVELREVVKSGASASGDSEVTVHCHLLLVLHECTVARCMLHVVCHLFFSFLFFFYFWVILLALCK